MAGLRAVAPFLVVSVALLAWSRTRASSEFNIKWFRPSALLRDSLFGLEALKEQFSVERETHARRRLHAQEHAGVWYVNFSEGGLDSLGPSAGCCIQVTEHPERAFDFFLPSGRVDANGRRLKDPARASLERMAESGDEWAQRLSAIALPDSTPYESPESLAKLGFNGARYYPVQVEWGDEIWAGVYRSGEKTYGNVVVARKDKHVIELAWRGPGLDDGEELLAFVKPYLDRIAELEPGEMVAEWLDDSENTYEDNR